ncbi:MAG: nicotinate-nucleotide adenylyltransferase [Desulfomonile tiedjei]|uniref:Nicotinate-nucleotide adenylyltransferase n=1 Tax=Desulfomonile tiedjei TaxID=2358 RepID=A0A9D6V4R3_9BACT|nr:nicotinate-nucleotide adenylyltransferase [Desulfomonile tiedjei]
MSSKSQELQEIGVIHGRFQVLHNDHMKYLLAGKSRCSHLVVGITNPDPLLTKEDPANIHRSHRTENPLTYFERYLMINSALTEMGFKHEEYSIVPFPINFPDLYQYYVPLEAVFYVTVYDSWGKRKIQLLESAGLKVEVMWERPPEQKGLSGVFVRECIVRGETWEHMVPRSTARLLNEWNIPERLRKLSKT